ncbi:hypothetical protein BDU57DRAFT_512096 [Ampelomyces quisqualis]|uniref:DUF1772-domain-containing protein n=1 Tax=Ampelomyces quisqualis TaxID=50730 RepID=A0A6A5QTQ3_AMPQU|nr:hypothetical protein BDU57DRAFT_512096 [Ampelomyces quisqualis]
MASVLNQRTPTGLIIAQTIGITASAYVCGSNLCLSFISIPAVMQAPAPIAAKQWYTVFMRGGYFAKPFALAAALASAYVASQHDTSSRAFKLNLAAAVLLPCIVPFTLAFIVPLNEKLIEKMDSLASTSLEDKAVETGVADGETTHALIDKWATLNVARAGFLVAGTLCATLAAVDKRDTLGFNNMAFASGANRM